MKTEPNDKAHPEIVTDQAYDSIDSKVYSNTYSYGGLTKREHFASMAMQGMLANYRPADFSGGQVEMVKSIAETSCEMADLLIAALNQLNHTK